MEKTDRKIEVPQKAASLLRPHQAPLFQVGRPPACRIFGRKAVILPDQALAALAPGFLDHAACRDWILEQIHVEGPVCPFCRQVVDDDHRLYRFWSGRRLTCANCKRLFTATTGTMLASAHLDYREFFLLALLLALGFGNNQVADVLACAPETIRLWRHKFEALAELSEEKTDDRS